MTDVSDARTSAKTLFDSDDYAVTPIARHSGIAEPLPDGADPAEQLLRSGLPIATNVRWKPLRAGLVNVYLFDNEVFPFADGRLLLRGDNGAGKSRVLALTLPLLLDGRLHATRVEPDRDTNRQVAWNLLMDEHSDRTGYSWIEFGRVDEHGESHFLSLGLGMRAVRGRGITDHWMFITSQRIGHTLSLVTPDRRITTRRQLTESLDDQGTVYESSTEYRRAVDEALFRLQDRFEPLLDLLLQLRQPQLARKLDLTGLESALVEAMPPVSPSLLSDAADAFRSLDQERETLTRLQEARLAVREFLRPWRRHLRLGLRRASTRVTTKHGHFEDAGRELREAEKKMRSFDSDTAILRKTREALISEHKASAAALQTLRSDPAMQYAGRLESSRQLHNAAQDALNQARATDERLARETQTVAEEIQAASEETTHHVQRAKKVIAVTGELAVPESLRRQHTELFSILEQMIADTSIPSASATESADNLGEKLIQFEAALNNRVNHWLRTGRHLAHEHRRLTDLTESLKRAVRRLDDAQDRLQATADDVNSAEQQFAEVAEAHWRDMQQGWSHADLPPGDPGQLAALRENWSEWLTTLHGPSPVARHFDDALRKQHATDANRRMTLRRRQHELKQQQDRMNEELQLLHAGQSARPAPPADRDSAARNRRSGAAFWELIQFVPSVPHEKRAGWETALDDSGMLNAWLYPDGNVMDTEDRDVFLTLTDNPIDDSTRNLSRVFMPAAECLDYGVPRKIVEAILARIGAGMNSARIWVDATGRWQNGPLCGRGWKPVPQYIGNDVRDAWRARRIAEIDSSLRRLVAEFADTQQQIHGMDDRDKTAQEQRNTFPDDGGLRTAAAHLRETQRQYQAARDGLNRAATQERFLRQERDDESSAREIEANDVGLAEWAHRPADFLQHLEGYQARLSDCVEAWRTVGSSRERLRRCREVQLRRQAEQHDHRATLQSVVQEEQSRRAALEEMQHAAGVDSQEINNRIQKRESELQRLEAEINTTAEQLRRKELESAKLEARLEGLQIRFELADESRITAAATLSELVALGLVYAADRRLVDIESAPPSLTAAIELSRQIEELAWRVADAGDEEAWKHSQTSIYNALEPLKGRLSGFGMNAEPEFIGDHICHVLIRHREEQLGPNSLVDRLDAEIDEHERVLSENERAILERHLLGEVAGELHERMQQARELVESMNQEVSSRPMKTGMQMRFRWEPDPDGLAAACRLLATDTATWTEKDHRALGDFLERQIRISRERDDAGSRLEQLATALDYRRWHRLRIDRRAAADQAWKLLTRKTYGSGSGGEKAIALTLPQVAAAAAYYRTADPLAPRLILMDEVFAGISSSNRAACMELLTAFELDVVMTSESEWGCYATVPQLAICHLTRVPDLAAIDNTLFIWNGKERRSAES